MDNSRELARLLKRAQQIKLTATRPPIWIACRYEDEDTPHPPDGVETFTPWIVVTTEGARSADDPGRAHGHLYPQHQPQGHE